MNIKSRLQKLEQNSLTIEAETEDCEACEHPPSMFHLRREYPPKEYADRRLITMGHCDVCGFDDHLWSYNALTEEQERRRQELKNASDFWGEIAYELELINAGLIKYALYPPPAEVQIRFTGRLRK
jgi:hypothetical protein